MSYMVGQVFNSLMKGIECLQQRLLSEGVFHGRCVGTSLAQNLGLSLIKDTVAADIADQLDFWVAKGTEYLMQDLPKNDG
jgi:hypothetical protein